MVPEQVKPATVTVGCRIDVGGCRGTVKYIGAVADTKGEWLGVDWDNPERGKHNGTHGGHTYFITRYLTSGSFIRPSKALIGTSCVEAIQQRYGLVEENAGVDLQNLAQVQKDIRASVFEVVGAEKINKKQSKFDNLQIVSLRDQLISSAGSPLALLMLCPNIRELDLSRTLINNWQTVADIVGQLKRLELLDVSENLLELVDSIPSNAFDPIQHLVIARAELSWPDVLLIGSFVKNLTVLQIPFNRIRTIVLSDQIFDQITCLDLEGNPLNSWDEINVLGSLSKLETLNASSCSLCKIHLPTTTIKDDGSSSTLSFPVLRYLLINDNQIKEWNSISELDKLPALSELKCLKNPVLEQANFETNHQLIIARIKRLKVLNGLPVSAEERRGAELDFLKLHGREWLDLSGESEKNSFKLRYPCYQRLVDKYGAPEESELKKAPTCLKSNLIRVEIIAPEKSDGKVVKKMLPPSMTVHKLLGLVQRLYDTGSTIPTLALLHPKGEVLLDNDLKTLGYYSVEDGATIAVRW